MYPLIDGLTRTTILASLAIALAGFLLSQLLVRRMIRLAVMDVPGARSAHDRPIPRGGGVGPVGAVLLGTPCCLAILPGGLRHPWPVVLILSGVALLALASWMDDVRQFGVGTKFGAQCASAIAVVAAAVAAGPAVPTGLLMPCCVAGFAWLMLCTNAMNFIDGLNGLASGSSLICALFAGLLGLTVSDTLLASLGLMLAAGLAGFMPYNMPGARIFMGDVGSQVCGLLTGGFALLLLADPVRHSLSLEIPLVLAGILFDVIFTLVRRLVAGERITQAHRGHLYQVAARAGMPRLAVTLLHWLFCCWGLAVSLSTLPTRPFEAIWLTILPQPVWTVAVLALARRASIGRWS